MLTHPSWRRLTALTFAVAVGVSPAMAHIPGGFSIERMPDCTEAARGHTCRLAVPNGDFEGGARDPFWHGEFRWIGGITEKHTIGAHLAPWQVGGPGRERYISQKAIFNVTTIPARVARLSDKGDWIFQWMPLPGVQVDPEESPEDHIYTVHAHVGTDYGVGSLRVLLAANRGNVRVAETNEEVSVRQTLNSDGAPTGEAIVSIRVPGGVTVDQLGIGFVNEGHGAAVRIDDVVALRWWDGALPLDATVSSNPFP